MRPVMTILTLVIVASLLASCGSPGKAIPSITPLPLTATFSPTVELVLPTVTRTTTPLPILTATPWPTSIYPPMPTSIVPPVPEIGWYTYSNAYLGYSIHYPPQGNVEEFVSLNSMAGDEVVPPGFTYDSYFDYIQAVLPDNLCVTLELDGVSISIAPPDDSIGRFVGGCPGLGFGVYRVIDASEVFTIENRRYVPEHGMKFYDKDTDEYKYELYILTLANGFRVTFLGRPSGMSLEQYLTKREVAIAALSTLHWPHTPDLTKPGTTCAGNFTWLLPGLGAKVVTRNRVYSEPDPTSATPTELPIGTVIKVVKGPICNDGGIFWRVESALIPDGSGWMIESYGDGYGYFLEQAILPTAPPEPYSPPSFVDCTSGWTRLAAGDQARVTGAPTDPPNRVRSEPNMAAATIVQIYPGTIVKVLEGPVCADGLVFWKVENTTLPGGVGWTAEGDGKEYWLEPYRP